MWEIRLIDFRDGEDDRTLTPSSESAPEMAEAVAKRFNSREAASDAAWTLGYSEAFARYVASLEDSEYVCPAVFNSITGEIDDPETN